MANIKDAKHFNAILVHLKNTADILRHLDLLLATKYGRREMVLNSIRLKAPEIHEAVAAYCSDGGGFPIFADWATAGNHVPAEILATASKGKDIPLYAIIAKAHAKVKKKMRAATGPDTTKSKTGKCPYCSKKTDDLSAHSCRGSKRKKKGSIWVISGGGANGIRNRR